MTSDPDAQPPRGARPSDLPVGVVLAGGRGRRFGGADKSRLVLAGRPLIAHVVGRLAPQVREIVISVGSPDVRPPEPGVRLCPDRPPPGPATGPLVGLVSVMTDLDDRGDGDSPLLTVPVDTPFLPLDLAGRLAAALGGTDAPVAYAATRIRTHPIVALWAPSSRGLVREAFARRPDASLHGMMTVLAAVRVIFPDLPHDPFFNINTPKDLEEAERILETREP